MNVRKKIISQIVLLSTLGIFSQSLLAADEKTDVKTNEKVTALETVTVTAQKREENAQNVPTPITVLGGEKLLESGIGKSAADILIYVPNASAGTQLHGRPRWWIRGVGTGVQSLDTQNPVGIYFDDVFINNSSATGGPAYDLERVEVLRGPQGSLWGKNTTGGAINFISKKPSFEQDGYLKLDYGTYKNKAAEGAFGGAISDSDKLAARASFHYEDRDGRFDNLTTGEEDGGFTDSAFRLQLLNEATPNLSVLGNVHFRSYDTTGTTSTVTGTGPNGAYISGYIPSTSIDDVSTNAVNETDQDQNGAFININWELDGVTFTSISAYDDFSNLAYSDGDNTPVENSRSRTDAESRQFTQEFRLTSPREDRWNWVTGVHYLTETIESEAASVRVQNVGYAPSTRSNFSLTEYDHDAESYAIFGSNTYNFTDQFDITAGLRWSHETRDLDWSRIAHPTSYNPSWTDPSIWWRYESLSAATRNSPNLQTALKNDDHSWSDWSGDITPQYKIYDNLRVYARIARGFRAGGYNTGATGYGAGAESAIDQIVGPEYLTSQELGLKSEWFDGRLNANASVFQYDYDDIQVNVVGPTAGSAGASVSLLQNVSKGEASGAEFDLEALPTENLRLNASVGILNTKFTEFEVPNFNAAGVLTSVNDYSGNRFVRAPKYSVVLGGEYTFPLSSGGNFVIGTDWKYQTKQYYFTTNQADPLLGESSYWLGNLRAVYNTADEKVSFGIYANNVTDTEYRNHALPGIQGATGDTTIWGESRTVGASITTKF